MYIYLSVEACTNVLDSDIFWQKIAADIAEQDRLTSVVVSDEEESKASNGFIKLFLEMKRSMVE